MMWIATTLLWFVLAILAVLLVIVFAEWWCGRGH